MMLADMIEHLTKAEKDLAVVGRLSGSEQSVPAALAAEADVLVLQRGALSEVADGTLAELLPLRPLAVLVVDDDGRTAALYRIEPCTVRLDTLTNVFARAMRIAARAKPH